MNNLVLSARRVCFPVFLQFVFPYFCLSGEYVLVRANSPKVKLDIQGRFEQVRSNLSNCG